MARFGLRVMRRDLSGCEVEAVDDVDAKKGSEEALKETPFPVRGSAVRVVARTSRSGFPEPGPTS